MKSVRFATKMLLAIPAIFMCGSVFATETVGFSHGNNLSMVQLSGTIKVNSKCEFNSKSPNSVIKCESNDLAQGNDDYFVGPVHSLATEVQLIAKGASGEVHVKKAGYDGYLGKSIETVNLWYSTLLQSPLLELGVNKVKYVLKTDQGQTLQSGEFQVNVEALPAAECPGKTVASLTFAECSLTKSVCQRYFEKNNYCQK